MQPQASPAQSAYATALANAQARQGMANTFEQNNPMQQAQMQRQPTPPQAMGGAVPGGTGFASMTGGAAGNGLAQALQSDPRYQQAIGQIGNFLTMLGHPLADAFNQFHGLGGQGGQSQATPAPAGPPGGNR